MKKLILLILLILPISSASADTEFSADVLNQVNKMRVSRGLDPFIQDSTLQVEAEDIAMKRALIYRKGHLRQKNWTNARAEGVGYYSRTDWVGLHFITCYLYTNQYRYAGAGLAVTEDGTYYTLRLR